MQSKVLSLAAGSAMLFGVGLSAAEAMPGHSIGADATPAEVILVAGGCGPGFHRGFYGGCRPNVFHGYGYRRYGYHRGYFRNF